MRSACDSGGHSQSRDGTARAEGCQSGVREASASPNPLNIMSLTRELGERLAILNESLERVRRSDPLAEAIAAMRPHYSRSTFEEDAE